MRDPLSNHHQSTRRIGGLTSLKHLTFKKYGSNIQISRPHIVSVLVRFLEAERYNILSVLPVHTGWLQAYGTVQVSVESEEEDEENE